MLLDETELGDRLGDAGSFAKLASETTNHFVEIGVRELSPDGRLLAYSVDTTGDDVFTLRFSNLSASLGAWSAGSSTFFYTVHDELFRPFQVWPHRVGSHGTDDVLVFTEPDARYGLTVHATRRPGERLHACHALAGALVLELRRDGFPLLRVVDRDTGDEREIHPEIAAGQVTARLSVIVKRGR